MIKRHAVQANEVPAVSRGMNIFIGSTFLNDFVLYVVLYGFSTFLFRVFPNQKKNQVKSVLQIYRFGYINYVASCALSAFRVSDSFPKLAAFGKKQLCNCCNIFLLMNPEIYLDAIGVS